jgi:anti-anti-sigma regulatory factor
MLQLSGELDPIRVDAMRDEIRTATLTDAPTIELGCAELMSISPEGIRMLLALGRELGKPVVLTSMTDACRQRIRMMGLEDAFVFS